MFNEIINLVIESALNEVISAIFGAVLGVLGTLFIVDKVKTKQKKKLMLHILKMEISKYPNDEFNATAVVAPSIVMSLRPKIIWTILASETLDPKNDKKLISELHEFASWLESGNNVIALNNKAVIENQDSIEQLSSMTNHYLGESVIKAEKILSILNEKKYS